MMRRRTVAGAMLACSVHFPAQAAMSALEAARVEQLLQYIESQPQARFVRNGRAYSNADAVRFLRAKLDKMGQHVTTAAQFIDEIASRSSTSGEAYLIRFPDGRTVTAAQFLGDELRRIDRRP